MPALKVLIYVLGILHFRSCSLHWVDTLNMQRYVRLKADLTALVVKWQGRHWLLVPPHWLANHITKFFTKWAAEHWNCN